jgi:hypothetical protein
MQWLPRLLEKMMTDINKILKKAEKRVRNLAEVEKKKAVKTVVRTVGAKNSEKSAIECSAFVDEAISKVASKLIEKQKKKAYKKKERRLKPEQREPKPEERLTYEKVIEIYKNAGIKPARAKYWFHPDRRSFPILQSTILSEDGMYGTPIAALCLVKYDELLNNSNAEKYQIEHAERCIISKPSNDWMAGSIAQLIGLSCSYVCGFQAGYDENGPGHPLCAVHFHRGYEDGQKILQRFIDENLVEPEKEDPHSDINDEEQLNELFRVRGYIRDGYEPYSNRKKFSNEVKSKKQRLRDAFKF